MPQVDGVRHRFEAAGGLNFHVAEAGEGEPVLLLHGWPQHWYAWRLVIPELARHYRVLAMDLRGFGWTDIAWEGFEKENMADDVARVLGAMEIERVSVIGHDWGGWIGTLLAMRRPDLVDRLIVLDALPPWARPYPASTIGARRLRQHTLMASPLGRQLLHRGVGLPARQIRRYAADPAKVDEAALAIYTRDLKASTRARAGMLLHRTFLTRELGSLLAGLYRDGRVAAPTLVLYGDRDPLFSPSAYDDHERHAESLRLEAVAGVGHYLPEEAPQVVAERALDFVASPARASS
jgi:pimeloyl-ACP methyl ester carboxylesterase